MLAIILMGCVFLSLSCRKHDIKTVSVRVPEMKNTHCVNVIQEAFKPRAGIISMDFDVENRTVAIRYDSMVLAIKNIELIIAEAGFDAYGSEDGTTALPEAVSKLPPECRE